MTQLPDKEQISAYVDGELSAAERDDVERHLAASAEAQREVQDYRSLSGLLQDVPREQVPPEFRSRVLHESS